MSWPFLLVVLLVVASPGADFVLTLRNTVTGGNAVGAATAVGVGVASVLQGTLVSFGLGALIVQSQPVFTTLRWLGIAYLLLLGVQSLRAAWRGDYAEVDLGAGSGRWRKGLRQGFACNVSNPKMFVFFLSLRPPARRVVDALSGIALLGFGLRLAVERD